MLRHRRAFLPLALLLAACQPAAPTVPEPVTVYVVRHAERADDGAGLGAEGTDPPLSRAGQERARVLAELLRDAGITHVHSTDLLRTRSTAAPFAEAHGLEIETYDASPPDRLAAELRATPGTHLVVGHSNTVPELVRALGAEPGRPIDPLEYDRIYVLTLRPDGPTRGVLLRYGSPRRGAP